MNAFMYSVQRLPACMIEVRHFVLGQSVRAFAHAGYSGLVDGKRRAHRAAGANGSSTARRPLAAYIASTSDLDDLIPTIVAYQIEWNKFHRLINGDPELAAVINHAASAEDAATAVTPEQIIDIGERLLLSESDWARLRGVWGEATWRNLARIGSERKRATLRMLGGSYLGYVRSTRQWWAPVGQLLTTLGLHDRPVYFISSNTHSSSMSSPGSAKRRRMS